MARFSLPELATTYGLVPVPKDDAAWGARVDDGAVLRYSRSAPAEQVAEVIVRFGLEQQRGRVDEIELAKRMRAHGYPYSKPVRNLRLMRLRRPAARQNVGSQFVAAE